MYYFNKFKRTTIIFRELSIFILWITATPPIINFDYLDDYLFLIWLPILSIAHIVKWGRMIFGKSTLCLPVFLLYAPVIPLSLLWAVALFAETRLINPINPLIVIAAGALTFFLYHRHRLHGAPITLLAVVHLILITAYLPKEILAGALAFWTLLLLGGVLVKETVYRVPSWTVSMAVMTIITIFIAHRFYLVNGDDDSEQIKIQHGVEILFTYGHDDPVGRLVGEQIMFVREGCAAEHIFIGSQYKGGGLVRYNLDTGKADRADIGGTSDDLVMDCEKWEMIIGDFSYGALHFLDMKNWPRHTRPSIPSKQQVTRITRNLAYGHYYFLSEDVTFFVLNNRAELILDSMVGPDEWIYNREKNQFIVFTEPDFDLLRLEVDRYSGKIKVLARRHLEIPTYKRLNLFLTEGPEKGSILISSMWEGTIRLLDENFLEQQSIFVAPGIRNMTLTPDRKILMIAGYTDGYLYFMDTGTWKIVNKIYLGRRMRALTLSNNGKYVYVGSSQGGFRVDIQRVKF